MLVYANHLTFQGSNAPKAVFRAVGDWLEEKMGYRLDPKDLKLEGRHEGKHDNTPSILHIYVASEGAIEYYAWVLEHTDDTVRDWKWITEIGIELGDGILDISFVVRIDEMSIRVEDLPPASQPKVVLYVINNIRSMNKARFASSVPGFKVKKAGQSSYSYKGLLADIEKKDRRYPIVLVSPTVDGEYLLNTNHLQEKLIGLAQVVRISPDFNDYEMVEMLGKTRSACTGEINILHTPSRFGGVREQIFLPEMIDSWGDTQHSRIAEILSWITHETNIPYFNLRIHPEKIAQLSMHQRSEKLRLKSAEMTIDKYKEELDKIVRESDDLVEYMSHLEDGLNDDLSQQKAECDELKVEVYEKDNTIKSLKQRLEGKGIDQIASIDMSFLAEMISKNKPPTPLECLDTIERIHGDKCIVLSTAKASSKASSQFKYGRRLMGQLILLVTSYREALLTGGGDSQAKNIFGRGDYAAKESDTVITNKQMANKRTFKYDGKPVEMFRHLKIGVDSDERKTIRTHFHWDEEKKKIIIGYCGPHLPVARQRN